MMWKQLLIVHLSVLLLAGIALAQNQKTVTYLVDYEQQNGTCGGEAQEPLTLTTSVFSTVLQIMELAAREGGGGDPGYLFSTTFTQASEPAGGTSLTASPRHLVQSVGGIEADSLCSWSLYVRSGEEEVRPGVAIADFVPGDGFQVILRYEERAVEGEVITTNYVIEHSDAACTDTTPPDAVAVTTPPGSTLLAVMEEAVRGFGAAYSFTAGYVPLSGQNSGLGYGYMVWQVNGVQGNLSSCFWEVLVTPPEGEQFSPQEAVSEYTIPGDGYTLTLRLTEEQPPTTAASTTTQSGSKGLKTTCYTLITALSMCLGLLL